MACMFASIPATQDGYTVPAEPIFRCNAFVATGGDGEYTYGIRCDAMFATDRERTQHQYNTHGYFLCGCGLAFATWVAKNAHVTASFDEDGNLAWPHRIYHKH